MSEIFDNPAMSRFEMAVGDAVAFVAYRREGNRFALIHTEVPERVAGRGMGSRLVRGVLDRLRAEGGRIVPQREFVAAFIERHPGYRDVLAETG